MTRLIHLREPDDALTTEMIIKRIVAAADSPRVYRCLVAPTLAGVRNGGDVLVHLQFSEAADWCAVRPAVDEAITDDAVRSVDAVEYEGSAGHRRGRRGDAAHPTVYRTLLLRIDPDAAPAQIRRFENATLAMPQHIGAIGAWQLSPVLKCDSATGYTHVWEQEFADLDGLLVDYMMHPIHWGLVDRWFDPECPDQIITARVCHSFCSIEEPVINI